MTKITSFDELEKIIRRFMFPNAGFRRKANGELEFDCFMQDAKGGYIVARKNAEFLLEEPFFSFEKYGKLRVSTGLIVNVMGEVIGVVKREDRRV